MGRSLYVKEFFLFPFPAGVRWVGGGRYIRISTGDLMMKIYIWKTSLRGNNCVSKRISWNLLTVKKVSGFPIQDVTYQNFPWPGIIWIFPARESLVSDILAGDLKTANLFYSTGRVEVFLPRGDTETGDPARLPAQVTGRWGLIKWISERWGK